MTGYLVFAVLLVVKVSLTEDVSIGVAEETIT
jgi:hypothetical protein